MSSRQSASRTPRNRQIYYKGEAFAVGFHIYGRSSPLRTYEPAVLQELTVSE